MSAVRALGVLLLAAVAAACGDRKRPGPPQLTLELPTDNVVTSPDTFLVRVQAHDDNGLDSVTVTFLNDIRAIPAFDEFDVTDAVIFNVPTGRTPGEALEVFGYARDLLGDRTTVVETLTVATGAGGSQR